MQNNQPIGIFDSGIGGLTVASAIHKLLPQEQLIYFGDTAHLPYGEKSPEAIKYYCLKIGQFLAQKKCKAIVIACNTASSYGFADLNEFMGDKLPVINVIDPVVNHLIEQKIYKRVGVIATKGTVKSDVYAQKLQSGDNAIEVASLATPLLVPMIEEGFFNNSISKTIINSYLSKPKLKKIDSLVLGCTHFPLIKPEIEAYYKKSIYIVDSAAIVAQHVKEVLSKKNLLSDKLEAKHHFYVSDFTHSFDKTAQLFFHEKVHLEEQNIWK